MLARALDNGCFYTDYEHKTCSCKIWSKRVTQWNITIIWLPENILSGVVVHTNYIGAHAPQVINPNWNWINDNFSSRSTMSRHVTIVLGNF